MIPQFIITITSATDIIIVLLILIRIFGLKNNIKYSIIKTLIFSIIGVFFVMFEFYFHWNYYIYLHGIDMLFFITVIYSIFFIRGIFFSKFTITTIIYCSLATIYNLSYYICLITMPSVKPMTYLIVNFIITRLLFISTTYFIVKYKIKTEYNPPFYYWYILISINLLNFCVSFILEKSNISIMKFIIMLVATLIINILLYIAFSKVVSDYEDKILYLMDRKYLKLKLQSYEENKKLSMILSKFKHDLKNHILCMRILMKNNKYKELDEYFSQISNDISKTMTNFNTGNDVIDAVLNSKVALANYYKIPVKVEVSDYIRIKIKDFEICAILSNLLDNAIEASSKIADKEIKIKISSLPNCIIIIISNKIKENILLSNPKLNTTKKDKLNHGIGLTIVDDIIKKYNGTISFYIDNEYFNVNIGIPK